MILSVPHNLFLDQLKQMFVQDQTYQTLLQQVLTSPQDHPGFTSKSHLLYFNNKIWLPAGHDLTKVLMDEFHQTPLGGHMGVTKTLDSIQQHFSWPHMRADVSHYVAQCTTCPQIKSETRKPADLLQPLPQPSSLWADLSMDFITGLPPSHGYTTIMIVVDRFSKGTHFGPLPTHYTAHKVVLLFFNLVCTIHGFPRSIISDRDLVFLSAFWRELFRVSGTKLRFSTVYHPQSDGQIEAINRVLEQYLRAFVHDRPRQWFNYLSLAEWSYNSSVHSGTGFSPFEVMFGKPPPTLPLYAAGDSPVEAVDTLLTLRHDIHLTL